MKTTDPTTALLKLHEAEKQRAKHAGFGHMTRQILIQALEIAAAMSAECDREDENGKCDVKTK